MTIDTTHALQEVPAVIVNRDTDGTIRAKSGRRTLTPLAPGSLLVRTKFVGICGSDLELLHGRMPETFKITYPHVLGHEWSGVVEQVGADVTDFSPGDRVLGHGHLGGNDWFGVTHDGAASELFSVSAHMCFRVPANVDLLTAAVIEPFACVLNGLKGIGGVNAGDTVHIHGLGAIGLSALLQAKAAGARIVVFEPSERRRRLAFDLGAHGAVDPLDTTDPAAAAEAQVGRPLADLVIEASGHANAQAAALEGADHGGRVLFLGVSRPKEVPVRLGLIQERNLRVCASTGAPVEIWSLAIRYMENTGLNLGALVSSILPFSRIEEAIARAEDSRREIKVMLAPDGSEDLRDSTV